MWKPLKQYDQGKQWRKHLTYSKSYVIEILVKQLRTGRRSSLFCLADLWFQFHIFILFVTKLKCYIFAIYMLLNYVLRYIFKQYFRSLFKFTIWVYLSKVEFDNLAVYYISKPCSRNYFQSLNFIQYTMTKLPT